MMKADEVLLIRAFRSGGATEKLTAFAISKLGEPKVHTFDVFHRRFEFCDGCGACRKSGICRYRDLDDFWHIFSQSKLVIVSSPVYNGSFPAPLKALLDRTQAFYNGYFALGRKQMIQGKRKMLLLISSGRDGDEAFSSMESSLRAVCSILNTEYVGGAKCAFTDTSPDFAAAQNEITRLIDGYYRGAGT